VVPLRKRGKDIRVNLIRHVRLSWASGHGGIVQAARGILRSWERARGRSHLLGRQILGRGRGVQDRRVDGFILVIRDKFPTRSISSFGNNQAIKRLTLLAYGELCFPGPICVYSEDAPEFPSLCRIDDPLTVR
jgi:hypothetical protein